MQLYHWASTLWNWLLVLKAHECSMETHNFNLIRYFFFIFYSCFIWNRNFIMKNKILQLPEHMFIVSHFIHWGYSNKGNTKREIIITCTKHFFFFTWCGACSHTWFTESWWVFQWRIIPSKKSICFSTPTPLVYIELHLCCVCFLYTCTCMGYLSISSEKQNQWGRERGLFYLKEIVRHDCRSWQI